jgi:hypothetical protein
MDRLQGVDAMKFVTSLIDLYKIIGYETSVLKRCLEERQISWGYFMDHNPFQPHCNSHPNNFIISHPASRVKKEGKRTSLLSPVDFDFAYCFEEFVNPVKED